MGRKPIEWDKRDCEIFKDLCAIFCTQSEICQIMHVDKKTLVRLINANFREEVTGFSTKRITFEDAYYRTDIGARALKAGQE